MIDLSEKSGIEAPMDVGKPYYPSIHLNRDSPIEVPDEGVMTVTFKVTSKGESERNGKKHYNCCIELHEVRKVKAEPGCCSGEKGEGEDDYAARDKVLDKLRDLVTGDSE